MFCKNCGNQLRDGATFCPSCGTRMGETPRPVVSQESNKAANLIGNIDINEKISDIAKKTDGLSPKKLVPIVVAVVAVIAIIVSAVMIVPGLSEVNDFKKAIKSRSLADIYRCYQTASDYKMKTKFDKVIGKTIDDMQKDLEKQTFDKDAEANGSSAVSDWERKNWGDLITGNDYYDFDDIVSGNNSGKWDEFIGDVSSAKNYCQGIYNYKHENNYFAAISNFSDVSEDSAFYENAQADLDECFTAYMQNILKDVDSYAASNDIGSGIELLNESIEKLEGAGFDSKQLKERLSQITVEYAKAYYDKAEAAFKNKDIDTAIGNMEVAVELQPSNQDYAAKLTNYKLYIPFSLYDYDNILSEAGDGYIRRYDCLTANDGSEYENCIGIRDYDGWASATYHFGGKYDTVTGKWFIDENNKNTSQTGYFEAYGDGKLIYTSPKLTAGKIPENISFSVSGIQKLELKFYVVGDLYAEFYLGHPQAQKKFP